MRSLRAAARASLLFFWILFIMGGHLTSRVLTAASARARMRARTFWFRLWGRGSLRLMGCRLRVLGKVPEPPYLVVSNHLSYVDILVMCAALPAVHFVSKSEVREWPLLGVAARVGQTLFLNRERLRDLPGIVDGLRGVLDAGGGTVFFPEGTTTGGDIVLPFGASLFETPIRTGHPVLCAGLRYETEADEPPASEIVCWWRDMEFVPHFRRLLGVTGFEAELRFSRRLHRADDRKSLAHLTRTTVAEIVDELNRGRKSPADIDGARQMNLMILAEARTMLETLPESLYALRREEVESEGVGAHMRHALEFYECFLDGMGSGRVDYDARQRDLQLESDPAAALSALDSVLERLTEIQADRELEVGHDRMRPGEPFCKSSLGRELRFLSSHAVHHLAIVGMLLRLAGHEVGPEFGVAPSTRVHRRQIGLEAI